MVAKAKPKAKPAVTAKGKAKAKAKAVAVASARLALAEPTLKPTFRRERRAFKAGIFPVAGCDEAGRGPLAGPVVSAAVILDPDRIPRGIDDSKRLRAEAREQLFDKICA